jgi:hypothetical protein
MCLRIRDNHRKSTDIYTDDDSQGQQLTGQNSYAITFARGEVPPVKGFWSLTLYDAVHFFHPNPLNRYSLGTKNKTLKYNADGSLTLYSGSTSPGKDNESHWLPAPDGAFLAVHPGVLGGQAGARWAVEAARRCARAVGAAYRA